MTKGEVRKVPMYINAADMGYTLTVTGTVQSFISAALVHVRKNAATFLTSFFGSPVLGVATFIATYASAAFSSLAVKKGKTGIAVIYEVTCVEQVKHQAGQEFTYLDWRLTGISVRWYEEVGKDKIIDGEE